MNVSFTIALNGRDLHVEARCYAPEHDVGIYSWQPQIEHVVDDAGAEVQLTPAEEYAVLDKAADLAGEYEADDGDDLL